MISFGSPQSRKGNENEEAASPLHLMIYQTKPGRTVDIYTGWQKTIRLHTATGVNVLSWFFSALLLVTEDVALV